MKVPSPTQGRTQPSAQGLDYFDVNYAPVGQSFGELLNGAVNVAEIYDKKQKQFGAFQAQIGLDEAEIKVNEENLKLKRETAPGDVTFRPKAEKIFNDTFSAQLAKTPPELQEAAAAHVEELKKKYFADTVNFEWDQQDAFQLKGLDTTYNNELVKLKQDLTPENLKSSIARVHKMIDLSTLPEFGDKGSKTYLKAETEIGLTSLLYQKEKKDAATLTVRTPATGKSVAGGDRGKQLAFTIHELNTSEVNANAKLKAATSIESAVDAGLAFERPLIPARQNRIRNAQAVLAGHAPAEALQARAFFESQGYTPVQASGFVGSLMQESGMSLNPNAANAKDPGTSVGIGQWNGGRKAAMLAFTGQQGDVALPDGSGLDVRTQADDSVDNNPIFANLPFETRQKLTEDAQRQAAGEVTAQAKAEQESIRDYRNNALLAARAGAWHGNDTENGIKAGMIDYATANQLDGILKENDKKTNDVWEASKRLADGGVWDSASPDHIRQANAYAQASGGVDAINNMDQSVVDNVVVPLAEKMHMVPSSILSPLVAMTNGSDPARFRFAYDTLDQLRSLDPKTVKDTDLNLQLDRYEYFKNRGGDLMNLVNGGTTIEQKNAVKALENEAEKIAADPTKVNFTNSIDSIMPSMVDRLVSGSVSLPSMPWQRQGMVSELRDAFIHEYPFYGEPKAALAAAEKAVMRNWGPTDVGGKRVLIKNQPEKYLSQVAGSWNWATAQGNRDLGLTAGQRFEPMADEITQHEADRYAADPEHNSIPSYAYSVWDENGNMIAFPQDKRLRFEMTAEDRLTEEKTTQAVNLQAQTQKWYNDVWRPVVTNALRNGMPIPPDIQAEHDHREKELKDFNDSVYGTAVKPIEGFKARHLLEVPK